MKQKPKGVRQVRKAALFIPNEAFAQALADSYYEFYSARNSRTLSKIPSPELYQDRIRLNKRSNRA